MRRLLITLTLLSCVLLLDSASALADVARWQVSATSIPTHLAAGVGRNEVQTLVALTAEYEVEPGTVTPSSVFALNVGETSLGLFATEALANSSLGKTLGIHVANATNLQTALEGPYGAGNVLVKETGVAGGKEFDVESVDADAERAVEGVDVSALIGTAEAKVISEAQSDGKIVVLAENLGDSPVDAATNPVTISDVLPKGLEATKIDGQSYIEGVDSINETLDCPSTLTTDVACNFGGIDHPRSAGSPGPFEYSVAPYGDLEVTIGVRVKPDASSGEVNEATVEGGNASSVKVENPIVLNGEPAKFGMETYQLRPENEDGTPDAQAGSHPFQLTTIFGLTTKLQTLQRNGELVSAATALPDDVNVKLPPGLIGNAQAVPQCTSAEFFATVKPLSDQCPVDTAVGVISLTVSEPQNSDPYVARTATSPIFNLTPEPGEPAEFGFFATAYPIVLKTSVRSGGDYGVTVSSQSISQLASLLSARVTFWGVPGDSRHDESRGWNCLETGYRIAAPFFGPCTFSKIAQPAPLLAMPTSCPGSPLKSSIEAVSWAAPGVPSESIGPMATTAPMPTLAGCNQLHFEPSIDVKPDVPDASTSTGLTVDVRVPQEVSENAEGLGSSDVRDITVALPEGVAVNPSGGNGLEACSEQLVGYAGKEELLTQPGTETLLFTPKLPGSFGSPQGETLQPGINFCSNAAKIGTAKIKLPVIAHPLEGAVYLATQNANPFGSLLATYIVAEDPVSGVLIKLAGQVHLSASGQLVATFENSPQGPLEEAELHFFGGERAPLATPAHCGAYTTNATFTPWSGSAPVDASSTFEITSGPNGSPCPGSSLPFGPSLSAGTTNINAGAFTPLTTTIGRADGDQDMAQVTLHFPPGLSGSLENVKLCPEAQANAGTCGPESMIGETTVSAGVGSDPVSVVGGKVYITEKYRGAAFGLSIVDPVKAGPFDLEHDTSRPGEYEPACDCVVVRGRLELDPHTAALTFTSNRESEGYAIPHVIDGIPVQIQKVNVTIDRERFTFNPTNCEPMKVEGSIESDEGAVKPVDEPFQVTNCASLKFAPKFSVSTSAKTSRLGGASLKVKLTYPDAPQGTQANIKQVKVALPKQLPSRLSTLQKACTAAQFRANPAGCPAASIVGHGKAITPLLPVPLEGPAYFVSNGGEAFPNLIVVLQGYGVTIDLVGDTFISKAGITSSTFKTVPDAPVGSFELNLPEGSYSALTTSYNLCRQKLTMPTEFIAQNGLKLNQKTKIAVTGCGKAAHRAKHKQHRRREHQSRRAQRHGRRGK